MLSMFVTDDTFQSRMGWLKEEAFLNIAFIEVTDEVSQLPIFSLKDVRFRNAFIMFVTAETFQSLMCP